MLRKLLASGVKPRLIAQKLKRSIGAIQSRMFFLKSPGGGLRLGHPRPRITEGDSASRPDRLRAVFLFSGSGHRTDGPETLTVTSGDNRLF